MKNNNNSNEQKETEKINIGIETFSRRLSDTLTFRLPAATGASTHRNMIPSIEVR